MTFRLGLSTQKSLAKELWVGLCNESQDLHHFQEFHYFHVPTLPVSHNEDNALVENAKIFVEINAKAPRLRICSI